MVIITYIFIIAQACREHHDNIPLSSYKMGGSPLFKEPPSGVSLSPPLSAVGLGNGVQASVSRPRRLKVAGDQLKDTGLLEQDALAFPPGKRLLSGNATPARSPTPGTEWGGAHRPGDY